MFDKTSVGSFVDGGFASHVVVPATLLHAIPDGLSDHAAALSEPLACMCHLVLNPPVVGAGDRVVVTGPRPVGLLAAQAARACRAVVTVVGLPTDALRLTVPPISAPRPRALRLIGDGALDAGFRLWAGTRP